MEIRSAQSFNAIPATLIRSVLICFHQFCYVNCIVTILCIYFINHCKYLNLCGEFYIHTHESDPMG